MRQEWEAACHVVTAVQKQREMGADSCSHSPVCSTRIHSMGWDDIVSIQDLSRNIVMDVPRDMFPW